MCHLTAEGDNNNCNNRTVPLTTTTNPQSRGSKMSKALSFRNNKPPSTRDLHMASSRRAFSINNRRLYYLGLLLPLLGVHYWIFRHCEVHFTPSSYLLFTEQEEGSSTTATTTRSSHHHYLREHYDVCIAGAGLSGAVLAERYATQLGKTVLVVEKRDHIGGNCYDYIDKDTGVRVSKYGAHLFHTMYEEVWDYVQKLGPWTPYEHKVRGIVNGKHVPIPVNIETVNTLFDLNITTSEEMDEWLKQEQIPMKGSNSDNAVDPTNSEEVALTRVGRRLYELVFKPYTFKQWNKYPAELGPEVLQRIPVRNDWDDRYFTDPYQALPTNGYTSLFENMFKYQYITVLTNADYFEVRNQVKCGKHYFTGPIDAYFAGHNLPKLEYRSLEFERHVEYNTQFFQPNFVVNHPQDSDNYTRVVEYKHLYNQTHLPHTVYFIERSTDGGEPYYPVPNERNKDLYRKYQALADEETRVHNVSFVGRLANYKYFNMDQAIKNALELFEKDTGIRYVLTDNKSSPVSKALASEPSVALTAATSTVERLDAPSTLHQQSSYNGLTSLRGSTGTKLPDWRQAVDCSAYDNFCGSLRQLENRYKEYPFPYGRKIKREDQYEYEPFTSIPPEWMEELKVQNSPDDPPPRQIEYIYPPEVSSEQFEQCLKDAYSLSWKDQLAKLLESRLIAETETNMIAFTVSDYNYAYDMLHDFFEMNDEIVGFKGAMFMVALDKATVEMACKYNYPVMAWPSAKPGSTEALKQAVANTKFEMSLELLIRGVDFLFYEMDVWFLQSPIPIIKHFHSDPKRDMLLSSHQNCPMCLNIGVYSVNANERTIEYFENAILMAQESPNTHDQWIMGQLISLNDAVKRGESMTFKGQWNPPPKTNPPPVKYPIRHGFYSPHEIVANERPIPTRNTIAIHTLCGAPMKKPFGKKILAKELGSWYGFKGPAGEGGYYSRTGERRRYLWMDGHLPSSYSLVMNWEYEGGESNLFHDKGTFTWTIATLLALARRTGRIFVMPKFVADHGVHFLWTILDFESVEELGIDFRETNFPSNPKAWHNATMPFKSVARTALGAWGTAGNEKSMFAQYPSDNPNADGVIRAWKFEEPIQERDAIDAWWAMHTAVPELDSSELLLVNPHFINSGQVRLMKPLKEGAAKEIAEIHARLKWCFHPSTVVTFENIVSRSNPDYSCHGKGTPFVN